MLCGMRVKINHSKVEEGGDSHSGHELNIHLNARAEMSTMPLDISCITHRSKKQEELEQQLADEHNHKVDRRVP